MSYFMYFLVLVVLSLVSLAVGLLFEQRMVRKQYKDKEYQASYISLILIAVSLIILFLAGLFVQKDNFVFEKSGLMPVSYRAVNLSGTNKFLIQEKAKSNDEDPQIKMLTLQKFNVVKCDSLRQVLAVEYDVDLAGDKYLKATYYK